jgi:6-phosphofructokinase 1
MVKKKERRCVMKRIAILTSGGDSSGMNACIRAATRFAIYNGLEVIGIKKGYAGLLDENFIELTSKEVSGILQKGGTILLTARCEEFKTDKGQEEAVRILKKNNIDGLIVIGGDGSLTGANILHNMGVKVIGVPATIDNDIYGTDMAIGVDTSLNVISNAIDCIKDTASSHERAFIIEVMGRNCGYLALAAGIASGAEAIIIPEIPYDIEKIGDALYRRYKQGKTNSIIIVAEGAASGYTIQRKLKNIVGYETRITVLGHYQRGGYTSVFDRILASRFGKVAVESLIHGHSGKMVGLWDGGIKLIPLNSVLNTKKLLDFRLLQLANVLV